MDFRSTLIGHLVELTALEASQVDSILEVPPDQKLGDFSFPCFILAKQRKQSPLQVATELAGQSGSLEGFSSIKATGPYLNFFIDAAALAKEAITTILSAQENYGMSKLGSGKVIVIDYSAPNIAKPFSIGHLRSTIIGQALYNILASQGYKTIGVNHLGDWGTQFGKLIVAYRKWGEPKRLEQEPIKYLLELYVKVNAAAKDDESLNEQARAAFKSLEDGDPDALKLWKEFRELSLVEFTQLYDRLGVSIDHATGESFYNDKVESAIQKLQETVETKKSQGALIVDLEEYKLPVMLLRKSDGATTYHSRDLATIYYRLKEFNPDVLLYVVGMEQKMHFRQLFKALEVSGQTNTTFVHADFGHFRFKDAKMSTRKGNVIFLEDVLDKARDLALKTINEKNPSLENKELVAEQVGIGAIIFADLSTDRVRNVDFDWDKMLSFEGETGPYLQYSHARAASILRKAKAQGISASFDVNFSKLTGESEKKLITLLFNYSDAIAKAAKQYKPHVLAVHTMRVAQQFNEFYHHCPVLGEDKDLTAARVALVAATKQVLYNATKLLGISAPDAM